MMSPEPTVQTKPRHAITVRKPVFRFDDVPRHWFFGRALPTHLANALNLLFPLGERFFIRSVKRYADRIEDPELLEQVRAFMAQEVRHGMEHERSFERLEAQGYEIRSFLEWYERVAYGIIEKNAPAALRLSVTVAAEHFTAMFAERALTRDVMSGNAHPVMRDLLLWHACEELEHKAVAFDVLKATNPSYLLRVSGLVLGASCLVAFWMAGARHLMKQEPPEARRASAEDLREGRKENVLLNGEFLRAFVDYLRPDFHPNQNDNYHLAERWLADNAATLGTATA